MVHLDFLNKNWYRKYPIHAGSSYRTLNGTELPVSLFAGAQFSTLLSVDQLYISKIYYYNSYVNITISDTTTGTLGYCAGKITDNNTTLKIQPYKDYFAGYLVIGEKAAWKNGDHQLSYEQGRIESSLVTCYPRPLVHSIIHDGVAVTGHITFVLDNVEKKGFEFGVIDLNSVLSAADKSPALLNCPTKVIRAIGNVQPNSMGNIDIYGIAPVTITFVTGIITITTPGLTLEDVCPDVNVNVPPLLSNIDILDNNSYKGYLDSTDPARDVLKTNVPEWKDLWLQYK